VVTIYQFFLGRSARLRLLLAVLVALTVAFTLPGDFSTPTRVVLAWDAGVSTFLALAFLIIALASPADTQYSAMRQDQSGASILTLVVTGAAASLFAIGDVLGAMQGLAPWARSLLLVMTAVAVTGAWMLTHTMFAFHYAHRYYGDAYVPDGKIDEGLRFPGEEQPAFMDFTYFAFVVGATSQTSDVLITTRHMRRLVWIHAMLSFGFYTVILALTINIVANHF
jgi:uncharacterized membrane protein